MLHEIIANIFLAPIYPQKKQIMDMAIFYFFSYYKQLLPLYPCF